MAVVIEGSSVVVANSTIEQRFPGGLPAFQQDAPNATYCTDGKISVVSFMGVDDANAFTSYLCRLGPFDLSSNGAADIAIVDEVDGILTPCKWLEIDLIPVRDADGATFAVTVAWLRGEVAPVSFSAGTGWRPGKKMERIARADLEQNYELVRVERIAAGSGEVSVYRQRQTGKTVYVGRPVLPDVRPACAQLAKELSTLESQPLSRAREQGLRSLCARASELVEQSHRTDVSPYVLLGIAARTSGQWELAEQTFRAVTERWPQFLDGWLELTWSLARRDRVDEAEAAARRAIQIDPTSGPAHSNLASVLLQQGRVDSALAMAIRAVELDPASPETRRNLQHVQDAISTTEPASERHVPWYRRWFR